jgi:streptomycin 6-kinase
VLKVLRAPGDEWRIGEILEAFDGRGTVRVQAHVPGAVLLEKLHPGSSLVPLVLDGRDEEAAEVIADVIQRMSRPGQLSGAPPTVEDWGTGFERYLASRDTRVPVPLVERAQRTYSALCGSQRRTRLLHGDLHHYNVLFDSDRGWVAIDPKGVVGEVEYEVGASLRNPVERPELFASPQIVERRLSLYAARLQLDAARALQWSFSQAVLSAIWSIEDGVAVDVTDPGLMLAHAIQPLLG